MNTKPAEEVWAMEQTKGELFALYPYEWDTLPDEFLWPFVDFCAVNSNFKHVTKDMITSTTIWGYPPYETFGVPVTCCTEVKEALKAMWPEYMEGE